jgi:hypothetical protein
MSRNRSIGTDSLTNAARAAGFAMATPDDRPDDTFNNTFTHAVSADSQPRLKSAWSSPPATALVPAKAQRPGLQASIRDWFGAMSWRAPA